MCVGAHVRECVRAIVHACVCVCVRACVRAFMRAESLVLVCARACVHACERKEEEMHILVFQVFGQCIVIYLLSHNEIANSVVQSLLYSAQSGCTFTCVQCLIRVGLMSVQTQPGYTHHVKKYSDHTEAM